MGSRDSGTGHQCDELGGGEIPHPDGEHSAYGCRTQSGQAGFVISPFYYCGETFDASGKADRRRTQMEEIGRRLALKNVEWINGMDILDNMSFISADEVHPNIYGVQRIADRLTERIRRRISV